MPAWTRHTPLAYHDAERIAAATVLVKAALTINIVMPPDVEEAMRTESMISSRQQSPSAPYKLKHPNWMMVIRWIKRRTDFVRDHRHGSPKR